MAVASLGKLAVEIGGNTAGLDAAHASALGTLRSMSAAFKAFASVSKLAIAPILGLSAAWKAAGATAVVAIAGIGTALDRLQDQARVLNTLSQATGLTVSQLGLLQQAAEETGVSFDGLARSISEWGDENSVAAETLERIGVSMTDAEGAMRSMQAVLGDVATKFQSWADGATKAEIATKLFGAAGTEMIPILNKGKDALNELGIRAQQTGKILDTDAIRQSRELSEAWTRLKATITELAQSWFDSVAKWIVPALKDIVDWSDRALKGLLGLGNTRLTNLANELAAVNAKIVELEAKKTGLMEAFAISPARKTLQTQIAEAVGLIRELEAKRQDLERAMGNEAAGGEKVKPGGAAPPPDTSKDEAEQLRKMRAELDIFMADYFGEVPWVQDWNLLLNTVGFQDAMAKLEEAKKKDVLTTEQFTKKKGDLARQEQQQIYQTAQMVGQTLTAVFGKSKAAAIAAAVINTGVGITRALAQVPFPYDLIHAGLIAAQGAAQIASIKSTTESGGGSAPSVAASGGGGGAGGTPGAAESGQTLTIRGLDAKGLFTGDVVHDLAQKLIDFQRDGGTVLLDRT